MREPNIPQYEEHSMGRPDFSSRGSGDDSPLMGLLVGGHLGEVFDTVTESEGAPPDLIRAYTAQFRNGGDNAREARGAATQDGVRNGRHGTAPQPPAQERPDPAKNPRYIDPSARPRAPRPI